MTALKFQRWNASPSDHGCRSDSSTSGAMERQTRTNQVFSRSHHYWREIDGCCMRSRSLIFLRELLNLECKDGPNKIFVS